MGRRMIDTLVILGIVKSWYDTAWSREKCIEVADNYPYPQQEPSTDRPSRELVREKISKMACAKHRLWHTRVCDLQSCVHWDNDVHSESPLFEPLTPEISNFF